MKAEVLGSVRSEKLAELLRVTNANEQVVVNTVIGNVVSSIILSSTCIKEIDSKESQFNLGIQSDAYINSINEIVPIDIRAARATIRKFVSFKIGVSNNVLDNNHLYNSCYFRGIVNLESYFSPAEIEIVNNHRVYADNLEIALVKFLKG